MRAILLVMVFGLLALAGAPAMAEDWHAAKIMGRVEQQVGGLWQPIAVGDVIPDAQTIRTGEGARAEFVRGEEALRMGSSTQIVIHDKSGERFTTIDQPYGTLEVEAEVRNVQHLSVRTPFLVAVVKGTRFTVRASPLESSVDVERGLVAVEAVKNGQNTAVAGGQRVRFVPDADLEVTGSGTLPPILGADGNPLKLALAPEADEPVPAVKVTDPTPADTSRAAPAPLDAAAAPRDQVASTIAVGRDGSGYKAPGWISSEFGLLQALLLFAGGIILGAIALILRRVF